MPAKKRKRQQQVDEDGELTHDQIWDDSALIDSWNEAVEEYKYYHSLHARGENVEDVLDQAEDADDKSADGRRNEDEGEGMEQQPSQDPYSSPESPKGSLYDKDERYGLNLSHPYVIEANKGMEKDWRDHAEGLDDYSESSQESIKDKFMFDGNHHLDQLLGMETFIKDRSKDGPFRRKFLKRAFGIDEDGAGMMDAKSGSIPTPADVMTRAPGQTDEGLKNLMMSWYWAGYYGGLYEGQKQAGNAPKG